MTRKSVSKIIGAVLSVVLCCSFLNISAYAKEPGTLSVSATERPNLPLIQIITENGELPTYEVVTSSEGYAGESITNNDYVKGNMTVSGSGVLAGEYEMKFKVRGNTSAVENEKKPYKIKLSEKADLLARGDSYADKTWILLSTGTNLKTYIGGLVSKKVGMEWTPAMTFVNVEINGDWQGLYILTEAVEEGANRVNISDSGYLFENDAYWWNEDVYFRTSGQAKYLAYTFKYPEVKSSSDLAVSSVKTLMQKAENYINSGSSSLFSVIDGRSWSRWLLARDILGQGDPSGSNMYFYKNSSASSDLIKMGPLWDFDSAFMHEDDWSEQHEVTFLSYYKLCENETFVNEYVPIENEIKSEKTWFTNHLSWLNTKISERDLKSTENAAVAASSESADTAASSASSASSN